MYLPRMSNSIDSDRTLVDSEVALASHFAVESVFESIVGGTISITFVNTGGSLVYVSLYDVSVEPAVEHHRTFHIHLVSLFQQSEVGTVECFLHGSNCIGVAF